MVLCNLGFGAPYLARGGHVYSAEIVTSVTSQGKTIEEALENLREALELYLEEVPEALGKLSELENNIVGVVEVSTKAPKVIGT